MTRIKFLSGFLAVILSVALIGGGCSFQSGVAELGKYLPVAVQAFEGIVSILVANGAVGSAQAGALDADASQVQASFADLQGAINAYNAVPAADKQTALTKVIAVLGVVQSDIAKFETDVHVNNPKTQATIQAACALVATTLAAIAVNLGPAPAKGSMKSARATVPSAKEFKAQYNRIVISGGYSNVVLK